MFVNVGDVLAGKYRVERILGIGGMGMVVAAIHLELDTRVAIKFMLPDAAANLSVAERFVREAKAAGKLKSEHICRVTDYGKLETGAPYIVMELMEGQDLAGLLLRRGALPVAEMVGYMMQALEGLADAHANGIIHRDLKPGNLFVAQDADGSPLIKVLDFGISKSSIGGSATRTGEIMGSPAYMAPEQMMSSKTVDARADIWAIGVILYQMLTGKLPWDSESLPALCMMVMNEAAPSPAIVRADLPPPLASIVLRCLEKNRDHRFASVAELAAALAPFGGDGAMAAARRVAKVLGKGVTTMPDVLIGAGPPTAQTIHDRPRVPNTTSTMSGSAAEIAVPATSVSARSRKGMIAWLAAVAVLVGVVAVAAVVSSGGSTEPGTTTATQPTSPSAPPAAATPPAPVATVPPPAPTPAPPPPAPAGSATEPPTPTPAAATVATPTPAPVLAPTHPVTPVPRHTTTTTATHVATTPAAPGQPSQPTQPTSQPATPPTPAPAPPAVTTGSQSPPAQSPGQQGNGAGSGVNWTHMLHDKNDKSGH
jgi:serine/threonine-protein kinase